LPSDAGDEGRDGGVVQSPGDAARLAVEPDDRVVGEQLVAPTGEREVVAQVGRRVAEVHRADVVAHGDPLVECREHPEAQLAGEARLSEQDPRERAPAVHVGVREQTQLLELFGGEELGLVDDQNRFIARTAEAARIRERDPVYEMVTSDGCLTRT
jgi:hypothetical protein